MLTDTNEPMTGASAMARVIRSPLRVLEELRLSNPTDDNKRLFRKWWAEMKDDEDYVDAIALHSFTNLLASLERDKRKSEDLAVRIEAVSRANVSMVKDRIRSVVLMEIVMSNGKKLRDCTFAEVSACGGWLKNLATRGKPSEIVGEVLTEADLHKIKGG